MPSDKKGEVKRVFAVIYVLLAGLLAYLLFFNTGIELMAGTDYATGKKTVFVVNETDRVVNNITVKRISNGSEITVASFSELKPKEKQQINISALPQDKAEFIVEAPFHLGFRKTIDLSPTTSRPIRLEMPETTVSGETFKFTLELCNYEEASAEAKVQELHEPLFFLSQNDERAFSLAPGECKRLDYSLIPGKKGETTIYFNVNLANGNEQLQKNVSVQ